MQRAAKKSKVVEGFKKSEKQTQTGYRYKSFNSWKKWDSELFQWY